MTRKKVFSSKLAKRQVLSYYLFVALFALVAVGRHFDFYSVATADVITTSIDSSERELLSVDAINTSLAVSYKAVQPVIRPAYTISTVTEVDPSLPDIDILGTSPATFHYRSLYYGHSSMAFGAIKRLNLGQIVAVKDTETHYYRIISRRVYEKSTLDASPALRSQIYNYDQGITMMTCGDGSNNDSAYRLVFFAVAI